MPEQRNPSPSPWRRAAPALVLVAILALVPPLAQAAGDPFLVKVAIRVVIFAIAATALNFVLGFAGLVSLCHAGLLGVGGYVVGILAWHDFNAEPLMLGPLAIAGTSDLMISLPVAALASALVAAAIGAISLRTSGAYFLMITLAFNQMLYYGAIALQKYGGDDGLQVMGSITAAGRDIGDRYSMFYIALGFLTLVLLLVGAFVDSRFGIVLRAAARNETRVLAVGINPWRYRLAAFAISGLFTGIAGALLAASQQFVSPADMGWDRSGDLVVMAVLGGIAVPWGAVLGSAAFIVLELVLSSWTSHWQLAFGVLVILIVTGLRGGLADLGRLLGGARRREPAPVGKAAHG